MLRLLLVPLLSLFLSSSAFAETIAATLGGTVPPGQYWGSTANQLFTSQAAYCSNYGMSVGTAGTATPTGYRTLVQTGNCVQGGSQAPTWTFLTRVGAQTWNGSACVISGYTCPSGQGWTLNGQTCTRPDCPAGQTRNADGTCQDPCQSKVDLGTKYGIYNYPVGSSITGTYCDGGCRLALGSTAEPYYTDGKTVTKVHSQTYLLGTCTASDGVPPAHNVPGQTPPDPPKKPPCDSSEGVMTSSTGAVHCVPSGIPGSNPPVTTKEKTVATNADGTTTTKETTTTRDPATGVEEKTTTTTERNGSGQVTSTSSETGTKGTTNAGDPNKPADSEFCAKNPNLQICKGGLNEEETQKKVKDGVEKVRDALDAKDFNAESFFEGEDVSAAAKADTEAKMNTAKGQIDAFASGGPGSQYFESFNSHMGNWFEPIGNAGCQAFTVRVGSWTWTHDHCAVAAKISEIGAYCMWVMLAFGIFSMTTKDHR